MLFFVQPALVATLCMPTHTLLCTSTTRLHADTISAEKAMQLLKASKRGKLPIVNAAGELLALATRALFKEDARMPLGGERAACTARTRLPPLVLPAARPAGQHAAGTPCAAAVVGCLVPDLCANPPIPHLLRCRPRLGGARRPAAGGRRVRHARRGQGAHQGAQVGSCCRAQPQCWAPSAPCATAAGGAGVWIWSRGCPAGCRWVCRASAAQGSHSRPRHNSPLLCLPAGTLAMWMWWCWTRPRGTPPSRCAPGRGLGAAAAAGPATVAQLPALCLPLCQLRARHAALLFRRPQQQRQQQCNCPLRARPRRIGGGSRAAQRPRGSSTAACSARLHAQCPARWPTPLPSCCFPPCVSPAAADRDGAAHQAGAPRPGRDLRQRGGHVAGALCMPCHAVFACNAACVLGLNVGCATRHATERLGCVVGGTLLPVALLHARRGARRSPHVGSYTLMHLLHACTAGLAAAARAAQSESR